jgi:hypothetical protein
MALEELKEPAPPEEQTVAEKPLSPEETERRLKRKEEADAVSQLLKEAFGTTGLEEARTQPAAQETQEETEEVLATYDGRRHGYALEPSAEDLSSVHRREPYLREVLEHLGTALTRVGIPPAMLPVYALIALMLMFFGMPAPIVLGSLAIMILFTALGLTPLDVLGIMSFLIVSMEMTDLYRQWGRLGVLLGF